MGRGFVGVILAGSLIFGSTGAAAASSSSAARVNPWASLAALSGGASAYALCGAASAVASAAQAPGAGCVLPAVDPAPPVTSGPVPQPIPVTPVEASGGFVLNPLILALGALAAGALIYFLVKGKNHHNNEPNSPA